jgi:biopolymer transport protein ExbB
VAGAILDKADNSREMAEEQAYEVILKETPKLETRISTINILAAASPLVGLLGTVSGMVTLFGVITVHGTSNPKLMAGGISEALIATKWGLGVAVPLLLLYNLMDLWSSKILSNMEKYSTQLINDLFGDSPDPSGKNETPLNAGDMTGEPKSAVSAATDNK